MTKKAHKIIAFSAFLTTLFVSLAFLLAKDQTNTEAAPTDTFRVSEYYLAPGTFTGTNHTLTLNQDLASEYFVIVQGSDGDGTGNNDRGPDENYAALISDPFGTGDLIDIGTSNQIEIARNNAVNSWVGVITVVECTADCSESGFQLLDVERVVHSGANTNGSDTSGVDWTDIDQVMLMGGFSGSGCTTAQTATANTKACHVRLFPSGNNTIEWTRNNVGTTLTSATSTVMVLEWGGEWNVQRASATGTAGGNGANATNEYNTAAINSVTRANTWVWGTGHTTDQGIGDAAEGTLITLGDGVNQNATETSIAIGQEYSDTKSYEVYALSHPDLLVDYRFKTDGNTNDLTVDQVIDPATDSTARMALVTNGCNGTGNAYPRPMFSARYINDSSVRLERRRSGQSFPAWIQGIDFSNIVPGVDLSTSTKVDNDVDDAVIPSQNISYTITIINTGTIDATGVDLIDTLDTDLENLVVQNINSCGGSLTDNSTSSVLDIEDLAITTSTDCVITYTADVKSGLIGGTNITNTANIGSSNEGSSPVVLNSDILTVLTNTDLSVTHTVDDNNPNKGDTIIYTITVTNSGPENATGIFLYNPLPSGITYDSSVPSQGSYNDVSGLWNIGDILNAGMASLDITVDIDEDVGATVNNSATLTLSTPTDYALGNNSASVSIDVVGGGSGGGGSSHATNEYCGDGLQNIAESCDDGNQENNDGCDQYCQLEVLIPEESSNSETTTETIKETLVSICPHIENVKICRNLVFIFGDIFGNAREVSSGLHSAAETTESCLNFNPDRPLQFSDLDPNDDANSFINFLKNTQIKKSGDYIFSGQGNHSSGKQGSEYQTGEWRFGSLSPMTRAAAVKTILIANCIPILEEIENNPSLFSFSDIKRRYNSKDDENTFLSQIFYTAYEEGIIKGYQDGSAQPNRIINHAELIAMMLRAAQANPNTVEENNADWYKNHFDFARANGIYNGISTDSDAMVNRRDFAKLLIRVMAFAKNPEIYSYIEQANILDGSYDESLPIYTPRPVTP